MVAQASFIHGLQMGLPTLGTARNSKVDVKRAEGAGRWGWKGAGRFWVCVMTVSLGRISSTSGRMDETLTAQSVRFSPTDTTASSQVDLLFVMILVNGLQPDQLKTHSFFFQLNIARWDFKLLVPSLNVDSKMPIWFWAKLNFILSSPLIILKGFLF